LLSALAHSYNIPTARLGLDVGVPKVVETLHQLGAEGDIPAYPSVLLGAVNLTPITVAQMYQTLAAGGFRTPLSAIREVLAVDGKPLQRYPLTVQQAVAPAPVYLLNTAMQQVVRRGTGSTLSRYLRADLGVAGKTGTTDDMRDSWFAGFTGDKVAVVWVGRDDNKPAGFSGATGALTVWGEMMRDVASRPLQLTVPPISSAPGSTASAGNVPTATAKLAYNYPLLKGQCRVPTCLVTRTARPKTRWNKRSIGSKVYFNEANGDRCGWMAGAERGAVFKWLRHHAGGRTGG